MSANRVRNATVAAEEWRCALEGETCSRAARLDERRAVVVWGKFASVMIGEGKDRQGADNEGIDRT